MDSNSNAFEPHVFKVESDTSDFSIFTVESDTAENDTPRPKLCWTQENTMRLIELVQNECRELWDLKNPLYKDKNARRARFEYLAEEFGTTSEEIHRKWHNLRTQHNKELRKLKRRLTESGCAGASGWEYFDTLSFLSKDAGNKEDTFDSTESVNIALAEFQAEEEEAFGAAARAFSQNSPSSTRMRAKPTLRVAASAPPPLPPMTWPEEPLPRLRSSNNVDDCQVFGDFVASELRTLRSDESRKRLKRIIQKAILQIGEEEDVNIIHGHGQ